MPKYLIGSGKSRLAVMVAAASLIFVLLHLSSISGYAAGDGIRVLSDEREVRFPGDVTFNLEVEGEDDIVEVKLFFRVSPSDVWTYTYPDLVPSRRLEANFNLDISGVSYLPPGTELEYYYSITDAGGGTLDTVPESFVYVDDRYSWRTVEAGLLTLFWHDLPESRVLDVARQVEESLSRIADLLQVSLDDPVRGIIYNTQSEARQAFPNQSRTTTEGQMFQGFAFPDRGVFVGVGLQASLIVHESAHLLMREATSSPGVRVPAWVNEGFASYVEPGVQGFGHSFPQGLSPDLIPLRHMNTVSGTPTEIRYFYQKAESVVGYLLETYSAAGFRAFLARLDDGDTPDRALRASYGLRLDELDARWASSLDQAPRSNPDDGTPNFGYLDTLVIALMAVVVAVVVFGRFVIGRLRRRAEGPEDWDGLTEEEWEGRP